ncbi:MAG: GNAT family N-acetyltransferase [Chloroflexia bacterium]
MIRSLAGIAEFREHERLQRAIWGSNLIDVPVNLLVAGARHGAVVLGAFDGERMIGLLYGFPAITHGRTHHHSHMLGVLPDYRRRGVGLALKLRQRDLVLGQGLDLITWTVDPLETGNNLFNFGRLGVVCCTYLVDAYGEMDDELNRGLPSDRLEVEWRLTDSPAADHEVHKDLPALLELKHDSTGSPRPELRPHAVGAVIVVCAPTGYHDLKRRHPDAALEWRLAVRAATSELFERGYSLVGCVAAESGVRYLFKRV